METERSQNPIDGIDPDEAKPDALPDAGDIGPDQDVDHAVEDPDAEREPER